MRKKNPGGTIRCPLCGSLGRMVGDDLYICPEAGDAPLSLTAVWRMRPSTGKPAEVLPRTTEQPDA